MGADEVDTQILVLQHINHNTVFHLCCRCMIIEVSK